MVTERTSHKSLQMMAIEEHLRIVREKDKEISRLKRQIRFREELDAVPSTVMSQTQKAALSIALSAYQEAEKEANGMALLSETDDLAKSGGMSTKTFQKALTYCDDTLGILLKETKAIRDTETGGVKYIETRVRPTALTFSPRQYEAKESRNHGGDRLFCKCGSDRIKKKVTYICMDCGECYNEKPHFHPITPDDQVGIQVPPDEYEQETTFVESYLVPDDQLGIQVVEQDLKDNLTLESNTKYILGQVGHQVPENESNNPPTSDSATPDHGTVISDWLKRRRGTDLIIYSTGSLKSADKYLTKTEGYEPDLDAFIAGNIGHIYGSRLRDPQNNKTWVLCFEIDQNEQDSQAEDNLVTLAKAGAAPVYWQRYANGRRRGHLELYFDRAVSPERARHWAYSICPDLEEIPECYPCQDKANNALSWPLYQRIDGTVYPCKAKFILPSPHAGGLQEIDPTNKQDLASLVALAVTPAAMIEEYSKRADELQTEQERGQGQGNDHGGVIGNKRQPITQVGDKDLAKQVIADFNASHSWDDIAAMCGGWDKGKFCAVWRGERGPSVAVNRDGILAHDYGRTGNYPSTFDQYQVYCLIQGIDKKADLAERCTQLRRQQIKIVEPEAHATKLFPVSQPETSQRTIHGTCLVDDHK